MNEALNLGVSRGGNATRIRGEKARRTMRTLWVIVALALVVPAFAIGHAAWAGDTGYLSVGREIRYGGYSTNYFTVDNETAYCASPSKGTPSSGTYAMTESRNEALAAALWYGWGGPGFDPGMWPATWYDGSAFDDDKYAALTHILVADCCFGNGNEAYGQCSLAFRQWCQQNIVGYSIDTGARLNGEALGVKLHERGFGAGVTGAWPVGFNVYLIETKWNTQTIATWRYTAPGSIGLYKKASNEELVAGNAAYSLEGAEYGIFSDERCSNRIGALVTNAEGAAWAEGLNAGSYWVREEHPSEGYLLDEEVHEVEVRRGEATIVQCEDGSGVVVEEPRFARAGLLIEKHDAEVGAAQGAATLQGALFELAFYEGAFDDAQAACASGEPLRSWTVQTDQEGRVRLDVAGATFEGEDGVAHPYLVAGDAWWTDGEGGVVFPLGTLVVSEVAPPRGYELDEGCKDRVLVVDEGATSEGVRNGATLPVVSVSDHVVRGGVSVAKIDAETKSGACLGAADFDGVAFNLVSLNDQPVCIGGLMYERGQVIETLALQGGTARTSHDLLPFGAYALVEESAGHGYLRDETPREFAIDKEHIAVDMMYALSVENQVVRGDLAFEKRDEATGEPMANVAFRITSTTTGESHVVVTDEAGKANTSSSHVAHSLNTNANDNVEGDAEYNPSAGVWFGRTHDGGIVAVRDELGALPYDTYLIEELPCPGNEGRQLVDPCSVVISSNAVVVDLGVIEDKTATVGTRAHIESEAGAVKVSEPQEDVTIVDEVDYANVVPGREYEVRGWLVDGETGEPLRIGDAEVRTAKLFVAEEHYGTVEVPFVLDASDLDGPAVVVFEQLVCGERVIASHCDRFDEGQTVRFEEPDEPYEPDDPEDPKEPDDPGDPGDGEDPEDPIDPDEPSDGPHKRTGSTLAKTGDEGTKTAILLVFLGCASALALVAFSIVRRRS